jgi:hypothetical protein
MLFCKRKFTNLGIVIKEKKMDINNIITLVLKVVAMAMAIVSVVMGFFPKETENDLHITLLSIGLGALALATLL